MPDPRSTTHLDEEALSSLLDDMLPADEAGRARAHVLDCDACGERWEGLVAVQAMLKSLPAVEPPRDFSLGPRLVVDPPNVIRLRRMERWSRTLAGVAAVLFVAIGGVDLYAQMAVARGAAPMVSTAPTQPAENAGATRSAPAAKPAATAAPPAPAAPAQRSAPTTAPAAEPGARAGAAAKQAAPAAAARPAPAPAPAADQGQELPSGAPEAAGSAQDAPGEGTEMQQAQSGTARAIVPTVAPSVAKPATVPTPAPGAAAPAPIEPPALSALRPWLVGSGVGALVALAAALVLAWQVRRAAPSR